MSDGPISWEQDADGIVTLTLDAPGRSANTMDDAFVAALGRTVDRLAAERATVRGVILTSAKKTFFAGGDLDALVRVTRETAPAFAAMTTTVKQRLRTLETLGFPVVAAVGGSALGGGLELALACHHRVVLDNPSVRLGFPEVTLGLLPGAGGVVRTTRLLGLASALMSLLLQGQQLRPPAALDLGLVDELASDRADLLARARAFITAHETAQQPWDTKGYRVPGGTPATPALAQSLPAFPANLVKQLKGAPYPAPHHILCAAVESLQVDVDTAFTVEGRWFTDLVAGQTSTNMIQAFWFDLNRVNDGASRPTGPPPWRATRVAVLGAGMMGAGIAHAFAATAGVPVVLKDVSTEAAERGVAHVRALLDAQVTKGRLSADRRDAVLALITPTGDAADLAGCDLVVEAVFEDEALKHRVLAEAEAAVAPDALLASNTSTLPITGLAEGVQRPADLVGMHFFSPVDKMPLVELIVGERTSDEALARAYDVVRQLGKTPIVVRDSRGFFTSRVFGTFVLEGAALLAEGTAPMSVERAATQAGFPAGPLTLLDEVTLTLPLHVADEAAKAGHPDTHPGLAVVRALVAEGRTGKAAGQGFFDWQPDKRVWPELVQRFPTTDAVPFTDVQDRMLVAMAVETARCVEEGVLRTVEDANIGSIMGIGFPPLLGGVLQYVDQHAGGVEGFVARADTLADAYGERFRPPALLRERAVRAGSMRLALAA